MRAAASTLTLYGFPSSMIHLTETQLKLKDAGTQLKLAIENIGNEDIVRSCVNAYISAARSITMVMQKESAADPDLLAWYKAQMAQLGQLALMRFFNDRRVHTIHRGNVKPLSHIVPIRNLEVNGQKLNPGTGTMTVYVFDNADEYMPGRSGNVFTLCEQYFVILKTLVDEWLNQKELIERNLESKMDDKPDENVLTQTFNLAGHELMEAVTHYVLRKYGNGRVIEVEWLITPKEGHQLPPIEGISAQCTVELR